MSPGLFFLRFHMQFAVTNIGVLNPGFLKTQMTTPTCTFISSLLKVLKPAPPGVYDQNVAYCHIKSF